MIRCSLIAADTPQPYHPDRMTAEIAGAMRLAGIDERRIFAFAKTGIILTKDNCDLWKPEDLKEFDNALIEYDAIEKGKLR